MAESVHGRAKSRIRLQEVALESGYSIGTVSRAISRPEHLHPATVAHVRAAAERLGYRPNIVARALRMGVSESIHVLTPSLVSLFPDIIRGIESAALDFGYSVVILHTAGDEVRQRRYLADVAAGRADGALLLSMPVPEGLGVGPGRFPPMVSVLQESGHADVACVRMDDLQAASLVVEHLLGLGHRRIAHIRGEEGHPLAARREQAFVRAMRAAGLRPICVPGAFAPEAGQRAMAALLDAAEPPTAVYAANDEIAVGALTALRDRGLRAPEHVSVVGHDDQRLSRIYEPAITTVQVPAFEMGRQAMSLLRSVMGSEGFPLETLLTARLAVRSTTAPPGAT